MARLLREEAATLPAVLLEDPATATAQLWSRQRDDLVAAMTRLRNRPPTPLLAEPRASPGNAPTLLQRSPNRP